MYCCLKFEPNQTKNKSWCVYRKKDLNLQCEIQWQAEVFSESMPTLAEEINAKFKVRHNSNFYLIADTLTLKFEGVERRLSSIDVYTNIELWKKMESHDFPIIADQGAVVVYNLPEDEDRYSIATQPHYEFDQNKRWVRIILQDGLAKAYYEVAHSLVIGLSDGQIIDIWLREVDFI